MNRGFTLIEMIVAISIAAFMLGTGMLAYTRVARKQTLDQATAGVAQILTQARANALSGKKQNCTATLLGWQVTFTASNYTLGEVCTAGSPIPVVQTVILPILISATTLPSSNPIIFNRLNQGTNISSTATITLTNTKDMTTKSVTVSNIGVVQ